MRMLFSVFTIKHFIVMGTFVYALFYIVKGGEMTAWSFRNSQASYTNLTDGYYCTVCVNKVYEQLHWWSTGKELQNSVWGNYFYSTFHSHLVLCFCVLVLCDGSCFLTLWRCQWNWPQWDCFSVCCLKKEIYFFGPKGERVGR